MAKEKKIKTMLVNYLVQKHGHYGKSKITKKVKKEVNEVIKKDEEYRYVKMFIAAERERLSDMNIKLDALEDLINSSSSESSP